MSYQRRDILASADGSVHWRVILKRATHTYLFPLDDPKAFPEARFTVDLQQQIKAGDVLVHSPTFNQPSDALTTNQSRHAKEKYAKFLPILGFRERPKLLSQVGRASAYKELKKTYTTLTQKTFLKALREFWSGGETEDAFRTQWSNCGGKPIDVNQLDKEDLPAAKKHVVALAIAASKRVLEPLEVLPDCTIDGRPRQRNAPARPTAFRVDRKTLRVFKHYYDWKLKERKPSLAAARIKMLTEVFVMPAANGGKQRIPERALPELHVFQVWFYKLYDYETRRRSAVGDIEFNQNERPVTGDERSTAGAGGELGSGDATIWNAGIRSRLPGRHAIGCPVVFRIRCVRTGMLLGISISLEAASWNLAAAAIANCLEDKVAYCKRYGIDIAPEEWPIKGLPGELKFDRGETYNFKASAFERATDVAVTNLRGQAPDAKGGSESDFRTLQVQLTGLTPGHLTSTWAKAQNSEWKLKGDHDLDQFMQKLLRHELARMKKPRADMELPAQMVANGGTTSPLDFWNYSIAHEGGGLSSFELDEVKLCLMSEGAAMQTEGGITFRGCVYLSDELHRLYPYSKARRLGRKDLRIKFDERLVDQIYVVALGEDELESPVICGLSHKLEHQSSYFGKCFKEIDLKRRGQAINTAKAQPNTHASAMDTYDADMQINSEAKADTAQAPTQGSKASQLRAMKGHRQQDSFAHAPKDAFVLSGGTATHAPQAPPASPPSTARSATSTAPPIPAVLLTSPDEEDDFLEFASSTTTD